MKWAWTPVETAMNTYCKVLSKCRFRGVITRLSNHFVTPLYKMIFEQDPAFMSKETMEALIDWYASLSNTFIQMYSTEKATHVIPKFSLDRFVMQEVAYHIWVGLKTRLHRKKKTPWHALPFCIGLYKI